MDIGEKMMNIAFIGHIDHGKSTLIGRLLYDTGSLPEGKLEEIKRTCEALGKKLEFAYIVDALEEERKQEMTIDTTQTFFKTSKRSYCIIDAPGHKEFLKNMITGASQADAAILIVDASEGVREQTKRHAYILKLLGIENALVAINKMDLVGYEKHAFDRVKKDVLDYLKKLGITPKSVIPVSAKLGDNVVIKSNKMEWYKGLTLIEALDSLKRKKSDYYFRFPVQDVYEINGERLAVGNIISGEVEVGERVVIYPERREAKVEKIIVFGKKLRKAKKPSSIGLVLEGCDIGRGDVVCKGRPPVILKEFETNVFCIRKLEVGGTYVFACMTQEVDGKILEIKERIDTNTLERKRGIKVLGECEIGRITVRLKQPMVFEKFSDVAELGRFVIKENGEIIAGGIIA